MAENVSLYALTERHPGEPLLKDKTSFRVDFSKQMAFPALSRVDFGVFKKMPESSRVVPRVKFIQSLVPDNYVSGGRFFNSTDYGRATAKHE
nr:hypothetical protein [Caldalkalibacillus mannanilyticus]